MNITKLNKYAGEYKDWKMKSENRNGATDEGIVIGMGWIWSFIDMVSEKQTQEKEDEG